MRTHPDHAAEAAPDTGTELIGTVMSPGSSQLLTITDEERVVRLQQLAVDLTKAMDVAEEQRRVLRDLARNASELAGSAPRFGRVAHRRPSSRKC
jgi:hypothetical protein